MVGGGRPLFNSAAGVSLLLCAAALASLTHSYIAVDELIFPPAHRAERSYDVWVVAWRGSVVVNVGRFDHYLEYRPPALRRLKLRLSPGRSPYDERFQSL